MCSDTTCNSPVALLAKAASMLTSHSMSHTVQLLLNHRKSGAAGQKQHCSQAVQKGQVCMHCIAHLIMHVVLHTQLTTVNGNMPKAGNVSPLAQHSCRCSPGYTAINVACQSRLSAKGTAFWDGVIAAEPAKDAASLQPQHDTTTAAYGVLSRLQMSRTNIPAASPSPNQPTCRCCAHISAA